MYEVQGSTRLVCLREGTAFIWLWREFINILSRWADVCRDKPRRAAQRFFEADRQYTLRGVDTQGVVEAFSWESEDGPDEDGFGSENYYDWWYLNEHLILPDGVGYISSYSTLDKRNNEKKFRELHDRVAALNKN